jgi:hypothetical protein
MKTANIDHELLRRTRRLASLKRRRAVLQRIWDDQFEAVYASGRFFKLCAAIERCEEGMDLCLPSPLARRFPPMR